MMFKSKYIFETKQTRYLRYIKNSILSLGCVFIVYTVFCLIFILVSNNENNNANEEFFKRPPDLIAVFTGDLGRIPFAINKALEFKQSNIFITGVYSKNTVESLLEPMGIMENDNDSGSEHLYSNRLEIDYLARNTIENVISTLRYLRKHTGMKKILIISHDYHIMRIKLIINRLKSSTGEYKFYYTGIKTDYGQFRNIKILYKEVLKLIKAYGLLLLWDPPIDPLEIIPIS